MRERAYLTTTLPYVNAAPHIGFALEIVQADAIARYWRLLGKDVFFNTGTDEHGVKIYRKALEEGKDPQEYVDEYAEKFRLLADTLNASYTNFIRTTDPAHKKAAQELWRRCDANGDIYKGRYEVKYCVGCELEKTESELENGRCSTHPNLEIESIEEENYFFKFSKYQEPLLALYERQADFVLPESRKNEIANFVKSGLRDFSISRLKEKMPWGVPVPDDDTQVMYVWFDALTNYISTLGWPASAEASAGRPSSASAEASADKKATEGKPSDFEGWWGTREAPNAIQLAGKDNLRQQSAMWQAMLLSANLPPSKQILIHGFITSGGEKMSKSRGNVIDPFGVVEKYGTDALRYWLLREMNTFDDGDFTWERFDESYAANLQNGLGNLVSRVLTMASNYGVEAKAPSEEEIISSEGGLFAGVRAAMEKFELGTAMDAIWGEIGELDRVIQETEPFKLIKTDEAKAKEIVGELVSRVFAVAVVLAPFLPGTAGNIKEAVRARVTPPPLFPKKS